MSEITDLDFRVEVVGFIEDDLNFDTVLQAIKQKKLADLQWNRPYRLVAGKVATIEMFDDITTTNGLEIFDIRLLDAV